LSEAGRPSRLVPLLLGLGAFLLMRLVPPPEGLAADAWAIAALGVLMAVWWIGEPIPIAMTATLPFLLLPTMGVLPADTVAALYWSPILFLVLGGALMAIAIERHGLHRRLAIAIAARAPSSPRGLLLAFMAATALASMLVSNTATTLIMMPVALAVLATAEDSAAPPARGFSVALVLGVAWAASIGGLGTLVGSPTNAIAAGIVRETLDVEIDFLTWAAFGLPLVLLAIPATAVILIAAFRVEATLLDRSAISAAIGSEGALTPDQKRLLPLIALLLAGWILLPVVKDAIGLGALDDAIVAIAVAILLFIVPSAGGGPLLAWRDARRVPWDILLLFGGGLALAGAITDTGLAQWIGGRLELLGGWPVWLIAVAVVILLSLVTEFASNVATAAGFMPVIAAVAAASGADPLLLAMPAAFAASWGFMMPAGTGPNAIAYGTGRVTVPQMVKAGLIVDLAGIPLIVGVTFAVAALL
jgi:sodium-dependent dicarboxylate transporter 2/3/5